MYSETTPHPGNGYASVLSGQERGKCICVSFPLHELELIDEWDIQTQLDCAASRSHYIRKLIRQEQRKRLQQEREQVEWKNVFGDK